MRYFTVVSADTVLCCVYLAGVELDESLLPNRALYCGGPLGGAKLTQNEKQEKEGKK